MIVLDLTPNEYRTLRAALRTAISWEQAQRETYAQHDRADPEHAACRLRERRLRALRAKIKASV